jgi:hypothetical protein
MRIQPCAVVEGCHQQWNVRVGLCVGLDNVKSSESTVPEGSSHGGVVTALPESAQGFVVSGTASSAGTQFVRPFDQKSGKYTRYSRYYQT